MSDRGFESLRFRPSTSTNTDLLITSRARGDAGGCISGSNAGLKVTHLAARPTDGGGCAVEGSLAQGGPFTSWLEARPATTV